MSSYHYGQAPNQPYGAPFMYSAAPRNATGSYRSAPPHGAPFHPTTPTVYGTAGQPTSSQQVYGTQNLGIQPSVTPNQSIPHAIRPASEIYPSGSWPTDAARASSSGMREGVTPMFHNQYPTKGGKGWGKGKGAYRAKGGAGPPVGNAANAIPLGKERVFAQTATSAHEEERRHDRQRSPPRPPRVIGRGRELTVPSWAKSQREQAPGEGLSDRRKYDHERDDYPRVDSARNYGRYDEGRNEPRRERSPRREVDRNRSERSDRIPRREDSYRRRSRSPPNRQRKVSPVSSRPSRRQSPTYKRSPEYRR